MVEQVLLKMAEKDDTISRMICKGLGGKKNISDVDCCITRLRCTVYDPSLVNEETLKASGASAWYVRAKVFRLFTDRKLH